MAPSPTLGKASRFYFNSVQLDADGHKIGMKQKIDTHDVTTFNSAAGKTKLEGLYAAVFDYSAYWNGAASKNDVTLYGAWGVQGMGLPLKFDVDKGTSGGIEYSCNAVMSGGPDITTQPNAVITLDAQFESSGAITRAAL